MPETPEKQLPIGQTMQGAAFMSSSRPHDPASPEVDQTPALTGEAMAWWNSPLLMGLAFSMFVHVLLATVAATVLLTRPISGSIASEQAIEMASVGEIGLTPAPIGPLDVSASAPAPIRSTGPETRFNIEDSNSPFAQADEVASELGGAESLGGAGSAGGSDEGFGGGGGGGGGGEATFFGVEARGSRFAFVVDTSGSMLDPAKIGSLQAALIESVEGMIENASFCIMLYNSGALPVLTNEWSRATEDRKDVASRTIRSIQPSGGTNPIPAFEAIFKLKPAPDAIYFMTDGVFSQEIENQLPGLIETFNRSGEGRVPLHCITFVDRGAEKLMRRLARQSGGSYTHVEGPRK